MFGLVLWFVPSTLGLSDCGEVVRYNRLYDMPYLISKEMAPKTRAITAEGKKGKRKKRNSFTDEPNPLSPLSQPPLKASLHSRSPSLTSLSPKLPLPPCLATSSLLIPSLLTLASRFKMTPLV
jgi:hypothetical protein